MNPHLQRHTGPAERDRDCCSVSSYHIFETCRPDATRDAVLNGTTVEWNCLSFLFFLFFYFHFHEDHEVDTSSVFFCKNVAFFEFLHKIGREELIVILLCTDLIGKSCLPPFFV